MSNTSSTADSRFPSYWNTRISPSQTCTFCGLLSLTHCTPTCFFWALSLSGSSEKMKVVFPDAAGPSTITIFSSYETILEAQDTGPSSSIEWKLLESGANLYQRIHWLPRGASPGSSLSTNRCSSRFASLEVSWNSLVTVQYTTLANTIASGKSSDPNVYCSISFCCSDRAISSNISVEMRITRVFQYNADGISHN